MGSVEDFEKEWARALDQDGGRWLIYPSAQPITQFELFEHVKAREVDDLLDKHCLRKGLVLEYGCGAAGMSIYLANKGFDAVACDISFNALRLARLNMTRHLASDLVGRFNPLCADVFHLPFADATFDVVMSYGLLEHFASEAINAVLVEVIRTLRPGGLFIADIAHGRFSVRTLGILLSLTGSTIFHAITLRWRRLPNLWNAYLRAFYENKLSDREWLDALRRAGLHNVHLRICHPFPPLALSNRPERIYVWLMRCLRSLWDWFHRSQPPWARWWGWLYLVWGVK